MTRKTRLMLKIEEHTVLPLEQHLSRLITRWGLTRTAELLGVSTATAGYWTRKLGISIRVVALRPDEYIEIHGSGSPPFVDVTFPGMKGVKQDHDRLDIPVLLRWVDAS